MNKSRTDLDRLFEKGISDVERTPRKTLSEAEIAAAAAASKSGAGVFLRSHTKEILLGAIFFAVGCLVMIALLHFSAPKPSEPQTEMTIITEDTVALATETPVSVIETLHATSLRTDNPATPSENPRFGTSKYSSNSQTPNSQTPNSNLPTPISPEPVVVKKTIVQRDTVVINETVIIKDTTYVP